MNDISLIDRVSRLVPAMAARAVVLDATGDFPQEDLVALAGAGALAAPLPRGAGGLGLGTAPDCAATALTVLRVLGQGNLAVGRVYEAHVNALRLIVRYAAADILADTARDVAAGHLFALWVTDSAHAPLAVSPAFMLDGEKHYCSAAGHATRAVVTAQDETGAVHLAMVRLDQGVSMQPLAGGLHGMRAAATGQARFDGVEARLFGQPGDYLREPDFSAGAWRTSAVTLGGLDALLAEAIRQLGRRCRANDPHQQARMGRALIAGETARLWMQEAAPRAEAIGGDPADIIAYVNFARLAVEQACLDAMALVQRSLGVAAFVRPNPVERICRDLATYLRQPAPDMVLTEAAAHRMAAGMMVPA